MDDRDRARKSCRKIVKEKEFTEVRICEGES